VRTCDAVHRGAVSFEADAHGPYDGLTATTTADRLRFDFDTDDFVDVGVSVIRLHHSGPTDGRRH
jgi:hypothetical protein